MHYILKLEWPEVMPKILIIRVFFKFFLKYFSKKNLQRFIVDLESYKTYQNLPKIV